MIIRPTDDGLGSDQLFAELGGMSDDLDGTYLQNGSITLDPEPMFNPVEDAGGIWLEAFPTFFTWSIRVSRESEEAGGTLRMMVCDYEYFHSDSFPYFSGDTGFKAGLGFIGAGGVAVGEVVTLSYQETVSQEGFSEGPYFLFFDGEYNGSGGFRLHDWWIEVSTDPNLTGQYQGVQVYFAG